MRGTARALASANVSQRNSWCSGAPRSGFTGSLISAALVAGAAALTKRKVEQTAESPAEPAARDTDIGSLIRDSVAAFVSGFDKGAEMMAENIAPKSDKPKTEPKPKA